MIDSWKSVIQPKEAEFLAYMNEINALRQTFNIFPQIELTTHALTATPPKSVRVVMLYSEPEHHKNANGLMFGSTPGAEILTYTQSVFMRQNNLPRFPVPSFEGWAAQGVLMLNVLWTSQESYKHKHQGWLTFTDLIIKEIQRMGEERPIYVALIGPLPHALYGNELNKKGTYSKIRCKSYRVNDINILRDINMWTQEKQLPNIIWSNINGRNLSLVI